MPCCDTLFTGRSESQMREEEELQEAIRRSLADQESSGEMQVDLNGGVG